jgi:GNAT superfamily N-acetyltransferase
VPGPCDACGTTDATAVVAAAYRRGLAYVFRVTAELPVPGAFPLCKGCFWSKAVYEAHRYGYDVHTHHPLVQPCPVNCLTRLDGRSTQIQLFDAHAADPIEIYRISKRWDGLRQSGTLPVNGVRTRTFYDLRVRQLFYEPLTSPSKVRELLRYRRALASAYVPEWAAPHLTLSFRCFSSAFTAPGGVLPLPGAGDPEVEHHAVALWDIDDDDTIIFRNSWGAGWGDRGYGRMTREYFESYWLEAWAMRNAAVGLNAETAERLAEAHTAAELRRIWMLPNPPAKKAQRGEFRHTRLVKYSTVSYESGCLVDVVEARNGYGLRLGWVHVFHWPDGHAERSEIRELFVWPAFRRQGIGSLLEDVAASLARLRHSKTLWIFLHEADGHVGVRVNGRRFAQDRGYAWRWRTIPHPRLTAVGEKAP